MRVNLKQPIGWRGQNYSGDCDIPDDLAIALGFSSQEAAMSAASSPPISATSPQNVAEMASSLLNRLNRANQPSDLEELPTIGKGAAKRLFANRPADGYTSLEQAIALNPELTKSPYRVDWQRLETWEG
jgi:hypothetical protein